MIRIERQESCLGSGAKARLEWGEAGGRQGKKLLHWMRVRRWGPVSGQNSRDVTVRGVGKRCTQLVLCQLQHTPGDTTLFLPFLISCFTYFSPSLLLPQNCILYRFYTVYSKWLIDLFSRELKLKHVAYDYCFCITAILTNSNALLFISKKLKFKTLTQRYIEISLWV